MAQGRQLYDTTQSTQREWWWLNGEQRLPCKPAQWQQYKPELERALSEKYDAMRRDGINTGLLLDLTPWHIPYQIWRVSPVTVVNRNATELLGHSAVGGYKESLWDPAVDSLPPSSLLKHGGVNYAFRKFIQVHRDDANMLLEVDLA